MVLSIGMIVKNEEKYLEKCLTALQPILDELDSELIIADTGSTDNTVEIAKKFTDNVFHFDWINDFSAARNATLEKAKGDWYLFVDADEIFEDCAEIIKFFKSGDYKKYNSASYIIRSFTNEADLGGYYGDLRAIRFTKIQNQIKFVGKIHERLEPISAPLKKLNTISNHYGYLYKNENAVTQLAYEKSQRNLKYLFEELETMSEDEIRAEYLIYNEIADSYESVNEYPKAFEYVCMGLEKQPHDNISMAIYYSHKVSLLSMDERFNEIIETVDEYFNKAINPWHKSDIASDCYIYAMQGYCYYKLREYNNAIDSYVRFIATYKKYLDGKLNTHDLNLGPWMLIDEIVLSAFDVFFRCCYQEKKFSLADNYTKDIPLERYFDNHSFITNHLKIRVEIMENVGYKKFDILYRQLDDFGKGFLLTLVRPKVFKATPEKRAVIIKKLASLGGTPSDLAQIYRSYFDNNYVNIELVESFLRKYGSENGEDMLLILMVQNLDITPFVRSRDFFADRAVQLSLINYEAPMRVFENYDITAISDEGLELSVSLYGWIMLRALDRNLKIARIFEKYGELGVRWYDEFQSDNKPGDITAALLVNNVVDAHGKRDLPLFRKCVDKLKNVVPDLIPVVNAYYNEVEDDFANVSQEFAQLAYQVKQNIRDMIRGGDIKDARSLLTELESLCPKDPDIDTLKVEINNSLQ